MLIKHIDNMCIAQLGCIYAAFLQAAAIEPDEECANTILTWVEDNCELAFWFPPPIALPVRFEKLDLLHKKIMNR